MRAPRTATATCSCSIKTPSKLYEMWRANINGSDFQGGCLAVWDTTKTYDDTLRGDQCTSADAAGFPISPLLFTADEVAAGSIDHAIRFILPNDRDAAGLRAARDPRHVDDRRQRRRTTASTCGCARTTTVARCRATAPRSSRVRCRSTACTRPTAATSR